MCSILQSCSVVTQKQLEGIILFDTDAEEQLRRIRSNLDSCAQTDDVERRVFHADFDSARVAGSVADLSTVAAVKSRVQQRASDEGWLKRGANRDVSGLDMISTHREDKVRARLARALEDHNGLLTTEAGITAEQMLRDCCSASGLAATKSAHDDLPIHQHGWAMWWAVRDGSLTASTLPLLPARLGLAPTPDLPIKYLLMPVAGAVANLPRFADSGGDPYWLPGGRTRPIEQCPAGFDGLDEFLVDRVAVRSLRQPFVAYIRTI